jgi:hypothetical protein
LVLLVCVQLLLQAEETVFNLLVGLGKCKFQLVTLCLDHHESLLHLIAVLLQLRNRVLLEIVVCLLQRLTFYLQLINFSQ